MAANAPNMRTLSELVAPDRPLVICWTPYSGDGSLVAIRVRLWDNEATTWLDTGYREPDGAYLGSTWIEVPAHTIPPSVVARIEVEHRNSWGETSSPATLELSMEVRPTLARWRAGQ